MREPVEPITAPPGTPDYQKQFEKQALSAADSALRLGLVRFFCGALAVLYTIAAVFFVVESTSGWLIEVIQGIMLIPIIIELGRVAITGKSLYIRFCLSGVGKQPKDPTAPL